MHGHTYRVRVYISGIIDKNTGWVKDFGDIKAAIKPVEEMLDHNILNEIEGLENPTSENLSVWLWRKLKPSLQGLSKIELFETPTCGVVYRGEFE